MKERVFCDVVCILVPLTMFIFDCPIDSEGKYKKKKKRLSFLVCLLLIKSEVSYENYHPDIVGMTCYDPVQFLRNVKLKHNVLYHTDIESR